jgi:hypothetical protein
MEGSTETSGTMTNAPQMHDQNDYSGLDTRDRIRSAFPRCLMTIIQAFVAFSLLLNGADF